MTNTLYPVDGSKTGFKKFNDAYGHQRGDDCLRQVAAELRGKIVRVTDFVGRYGGEEFGVVLGATSIEGGRRVAEGLVSAIYGLNIPHSASLTADQVSIGLAVAFPKIGESSPRTTKLYDRRSDEILLDEVEKIVI